MPSLCIKNLTKRYGENVVLNDLSLELENAEVWALVAPNGTGKTTLLDCITNLNSYQSGQITVNGIDNRDNAIFKKLSYLQDASILFPNLTGLDHLKFVANIQKLPKTRINEIVSLTKIEKFYKRPVKTYSLGMKQRLLLAIALINNPEVLIYAIDTTSNDQTLEILSPFVVSAEIEKDMIICQFKKNSFDDAIKAIQDKGIKLIKIREHINASEQMYQRLFAE